MNELITLQQLDRKQLPKAFQKMESDELFAIMSNMGKHEDLCELEEVQPIAVLFREDTFVDEETGEKEDEIRTTLITSEGTFSGFSYTFRKQAEVLIMVYGQELPKIRVQKIARGKKQHYQFSVLKGDK